MTVRKINSRYSLQEAGKPLELTVRYSVLDKICKEAGKPLELTGYSVIS